VSQQTICDACGEPIDTSLPYYAVTGVKQHVVEGTPTVIDPPQSIDFHEAHVPWLPENQPVEP
jgi:hypothetical protein